jgi:hypothetical protein
LSIAVQKKDGETTNATWFKVVNGEVGMSVSFGDAPAAELGKAGAQTELGREFTEPFFTDGAGDVAPDLRMAGNMVTIPMPAELTKGNPDNLTFEWGTP